MNTLPLVDPQLRPLIDMMPTVMLTSDSLPDMRAGMQRLEQAPQNPEDGVSVERIVAPGPAGAPDIGLLCYTPANTDTPMPCIYHMHGGGFVGGRIAQMQATHRALCAEVKAVIVTVEYRLAPETIFPGAIEDCYAGLGWLFANAPRLGVDTARIGVMGESAGGGFAAALALLARDRGEYQLAFQHLIYPMLDDRTCTTNVPHPFAGEFIWPAQNNHFGWSSLLGHEPGRDGVSPYAAPARATDLSGLPPTFISTGALDIFVDEDMDYARRLMRAGVATELHVYPGAFHGFDLMAGATIAQEALSASRRALHRALHPEV